MQGVPRGFGLGGFLVLAASPADFLPFEIDGRDEGLRVAASRFLEDAVGHRFLLVGLHAFLQVGLRVGREVDRGVFDILLEDVADEVVADAEPLVEVDGPDEGFEDVFEQGFVGRGVLGEGGADADIFVQSELAAIGGFRGRADELALQDGELPLLHVGMVDIAEFRDDHADHRVPEEFEAFVILVARTGPPVLGGMGKGEGVELFVLRQYAEPAI